MLLLMHADDKRDAAWHLLLLFLPLCFLRFFPVSFSFFLRKVLGFELCAHGLTALWVGAKGRLKTML